METTRWNRLEYKQTGKAAFLANYWPMVGGILLLLLLMGDFLPTRVHETVTNCIAICQDLALYGPLEFLYTVEYYTNPLGPLFHFPGRGVACDPVSGQQSL